MASKDEKDTLVEKDPHKRMFRKFMFLLVVAVLVVAMYIWKWTGEPKEQSPEEMFSDSSQTESQESDQPENLNEGKIDAALDNQSSAQTDSEQQGANQAKGQTNTNDLEGKMQQRYGEKSISQAKEQAETGLALYLLQVSNWDKWKGVVTDSFLKKVQPDIQSLKDKRANRQLDNIELFASNNSQQNKVTFGAFATWHVTINGKTTNKPMQLYYITLKQNDEKWLVSNIVTPNQKSMEGNEGKEES